jgi:hypothetical protein
MLDKYGKFIRSTNEDPKLIPNAYSFCSDYRNLITGSSIVKGTPIIHPHPEPKPYKFLFIPNRYKNRLVEVGVRIDFVAKTLTEALGSDANIVSMAVFDPKGTSFGRFTAQGYQFNESQMQLPDKFPSVVDHPDEFHFYTKVGSSHTKCCQCEVLRLQQIALTWILTIL